MKDISLVISEIADYFGEKAKENLIYKCFGKHSHEIQLILKYSQQNSKILDVGGGVGVNLLCL